MEILEGYFYNQPGLKEGDKIIVVESRLSVYDSPGTVYTLEYKYGCLNVFTENHGYRNGHGLRYKLQKPEPKGLIKFLREHGA